MKTREKNKSSKIYNCFIYPGKLFAFMVQVLTIIMLTVPLHAQDLIGNIIQPDLKPTCLAISEAQNKVFVADSNGTIFVYDGSDYSKISLISTGISGINQMAISEKFGKLYVAEFGMYGYKVGVINAKTGNLIRTIDVGAWIQLQKDEESGKIYCLSSSGLYQIDVATDSLRKAAGIKGTVASSLAVNPVTHEVFYLWGAYSPPLKVIDAFTLNSFDVDVGGYGIGVNYNQNKIYVSSLEGPFHIYNRITGKLSLTPTFNDAGILAFDPIGNQVYSSVEVDGWTTIIDGKTDSSFNVKIMAAYAPYVCYATKHIFYSGSPVKILDGNTLKIATLDTVSANKDLIAVNQTTQKIFVASSGKIAVIQDQEGSHSWPETPKKVSPNNNYVNLPVTNATLKWRTSPNATSYRLEISDSYGEFKQRRFFNQTGIKDTLYPLTGFDLKPNKWYYWDVTATNGHVSSPSTGTWGFKTSSAWTSVEHLSYVTPKQYQLFQNYPNPFNDKTTISFCLKSKSYVLLKIFDAFGREVSVLVSGEFSPGEYSQRWNANGFSSGLYFYQLQVGSNLESKKLVLLH